MLWAIIKSGNKQYKVKSKDLISIDYISAADGKKVEFEEVLLLAEGDKVTVGRPIIAKAKVSGTVVATEKGKKIRVVKFKPKSKYLRTLGFRKKNTTVKIDDIKYS